MKRLIFISLLFVITISVRAQNSASNAPSDKQKSGYVYDVDVASKALIEYQLQESKNDKDFNLLIVKDDFPVLNSKEQLDDEYISKLKSWMQDNHELIISALKNRKDIVFQF